jgi:hypothetical protein
LFPYFPLTSDLASAVLFQYAYNSQVKVICSKFYFIFFSFFLFFFFFFFLVLEMSSEKWTFGAMCYALNVKCLNTWSSAGGII